MPLISGLSMFPEPVTPPQDNAIDTGRRHANSEGGAPHCEATATVMGGG